MFPMPKFVLFRIVPRAALPLLVAGAVVLCSHASYAQNTRLFVVPHWVKNNAGPNATLSSLTGSLLNPRPARFVGSPPYAKQYNGQMMAFQYYTGVAGQDNAMQVGNPGATMVTGPNATVNYPAVPAAAAPLGNSLVASLKPPNQPLQTWTVKWLHATVAWSGKTKATIEFDPPMLGAPGEVLSHDDFDLIGSLPPITETTPQGGTTTYTVDDSTPYRTNLDLAFTPTSTPGLYDISTEGSDNYIALNDPKAQEDILSFPDEPFGTLDYTSFNTSTDVGNGTFDFTALDLSGTFNVDSAGDFTGDATDDPGTTFQTPELIVNAVPEPSPLSALGIGIGLLAAGLFIRTHRRRARRYEIE